jgi:flagellar biosynthetic protein FliP
MKIVLVLSVLTLVPSLLLTMTAFTRIVIVLSFVRRALAIQGLPPNQILIGLSLFLTFFVMAPVFGRINEVAVQPDVRGEITDMQALERAMGPLREFMFKQTRKKDLGLFLHVAKMEKPRTRDDVPTHILLPAFALSEIKTAFQMGFIVYLPMLVVDMVVAMLLTSMGMFMLPPAMVSVPLKILLFVLVDGWHLVIGSLAQSFC